MEQRTRDKKDHCDAPVDLRSVVGSRPQVDRRSAAFVLVAALLWGTTGTAQSFAPDGASPLTVASVRLCVGGVILLVWAFARSGRAGMAACWTRGTWLLTVVGCGAVTAYQALFFSAVRETGVAIGTLVAIGCAPVIAGLLGLSIGERLSGVWGLATAVTVTGLALLLMPGDSGVVRPLGVLAAFGAAAAYSTYTVIGRVLLARGVEGRVVTGTFFGFACLPAVLLAAGDDYGWLTTWNGAGVALWLGIGATAVPYLLWIRGLKATMASTATVIGLAEPLTASLLGIWFLGEEVTGWTVIGMVTIIVGLILAGYQGRTTPRTTSSDRP